MDAICGRPQRPNALAQPREPLAARPLGRAAGRDGLCISRARRARAVWGSHHHGSARLFVEAVLVGEERSLAVGGGELRREHEKDTRVVELDHRAMRISPTRSATERGIRYTLHNDPLAVRPDMIRMLWSATTRRTRSS